MKTRIWILGVFAALCLVSTGGYTWALHDAYLKQVEE